MATESGDIISVAAAEDLRAYQYHVVAINDNLRAAAADTFVGVGVLLNTPNSGEHAALKVAGCTKAKAGGTITAGLRCGLTASGTITAAASGAAAIGFAIEAVASGGITPFVLQPGIGAV